MSGTRQLLVGAAIGRVLLQPFIHEHPELSGKPAVISKHSDVRSPQCPVDQNHLRNHVPLGDVKSRGVRPQREIDCICIPVSLHESAEHLEGVRPIQRGKEKRVDIRLSAADVWQVYLEQVDLVGSVEETEPWRNDRRRFLFGLDVMECVPDELTGGVVHDIEHEFISRALARVTLQWRPQTMGAFRDLISAAVSKRERRSHDQTQGRRRRKR